MEIDKKSTSLGQCYSNDIQLVWKVSNRADRNPTALYQPYDVIFNGEDVIVAEGFWPYSRLQVFNSKGRSIRSIGQGDILPFGIAINAAGNIVLTDHNDRTVKTFTTDGKELIPWKSQSFEWPTGIAVDPHGRYYISDWSLGTVNIHAEGGEKVREFRTISDGSMFSSPAYVAVDSYQRIIVSDSFDRTVKVFDDSGRLLLNIERCDKGGKLIDPRGVCTDSQSNIVVADWGDDKVRLYSTDGRWIEDLLTAENGIQHPRGVAISSSNVIAITEQKLNACPTLKVFRVG